VGEAQLVCSQRPAAAGAIRVACVGDSITAVGHTSSKAHQYPSQLQDLLDARHGNGTYSVTNLGTCGTTLQKDGASPYWKSATYAALVAAQWDVIIIMLGTNDARDVGSGGPEHWPSAGCDNATSASLSGCNFAADYKSLLDIVKGLGENGTAPAVYMMVPPALMQQGAYGMNQTIINTIFPKLVPLIAAANADVVTGVVDVYSGMGGVPAPAWQTELPPKCVLNSTWPPCRWYCDAQSCAPGQCHPNDVGCAHLAEVVYDGIWGKAPTRKQPPHAVASNTKQPPHAAAVSTQRPYTVAGTIDVGTLENSIFSWHGTLYLLENINSQYDDQAGNWCPEFDGHSYARVRRLHDGVVVSNISSTIGYGFISAFPDYKHDRLWLFGTNHDRSGHGPSGGYRCPGQSVTAWWAQGADLTHWDMACTDALSADNVEVAAVHKPPSTLPIHGYVMSDECPGFRINNSTDGNLTRGWVVAPGSSKGPCGGPSVRWAPEPTNSSRGYYYRITGGHTVSLARSRDLREPWQSVTMITPTAEDAQVSPYAGFAAVAARKRFGLNRDHWSSWDWNSNDADVCCMDPSVEGSYMVWGASTQGRAPKPPVPRNQSCVNVVGTSPLKLPALLDAFFPAPLPPVGY